MFFKLAWGQGARNRSLWSGKEASCNTIDNRKINEEFEKKTKNLTRIPDQHKEQRQYFLVYSPNEFNMVLSFNSVLLRLSTSAERSKSRFPGHSLRNFAKCLAWHLSQWRQGGFAEAAAGPKTNEQRFG